MRAKHRAKRQPTGDYNVGFARTPERTRFKKGKSGNPKGRPKRSDNLIELLRQVMSETVEVREGEKTRRISTTGGDGPGCCTESRRRAIGRASQR